MAVVILDDRAVLEVSGPEAGHFLQNIVTTDIDGLAAGEVRAGALLAPQGKILFDFLAFRHGGATIALDVPASAADDFLRRLMLYRLRAKVGIGKRQQGLVAVSWETDSAASQTDSTSGWLVDTRFSTPTFRRYAEPLPPPSAPLADWTLHRIRSGVAESGSDYALGEAFPHDVLLDQLGGVGFRKGCYVGQEVVSRMQHRGTARRRVLIATADADLPPPGTAITAAGRALGTLGSVSGREGLAPVRIDRVKEAMDAGEAIEAAGVRLDLSIPAWAGFTFPSPSPPGPSAPPAGGADEG